MSADTPIHHTRTGQQFYERTVPELVRRLERLNEFLERLMADREGQESR